MLIHYEGNLHMTKYREILRLTALGLSLRDIEKSLKVSRKTIVKVQKRADELSLSGPLDESLTDAELEQQMFPKDLSPKSTKRMLNDIPDGNALISIIGRIQHRNQPLRKNNFNN